MESLKNVNLRSLHPMQLRRFLSTWLDFVKPTSTQDKVYLTSSGTIYYIFSKFAANCTDFSPCFCFLVKAYKGVGKSLGISRLFIPVRFWYNTDKSIRSDETLWSRFHTPHWSTRAHAAFGLHRLGPLGVPHRAFVVPDRRKTYGKLKFEKYL